VNTPEELARWVVQEESLQESHWLEWKSIADLRQREWQARSAKFVLAAANRPAALARATHEGHAFMLIGLEPGRLVGTTVVDPATIGAGLARYLGSTGPSYLLDYVTLGETVVVVITVLPTPAGHRPYLARGSFSDSRPVLQDGRIYVRRTGANEEATAAEVDAMLIERVSARIAAGPRWPMQPVDAWRDGRTVYVRAEHGDAVAVHRADNYTNLMEMARERPGLPQQLPPTIRARVKATFDPSLALVEANPARAVEDTWMPLRQLALEVYEQLLARKPPNKVIDMAAELAASGYIERGWVDVAYPLYYWPLEHGNHEVETTVGEARTYVSLGHTSP
jgi:hypothetical protein